MQIHEGQYFDRLKPPEDIGPWYVDDLRKDVAKFKGTFLVAEANGIVAGHAALLTEMSSEGERDEIVYAFAYVTELAVLKSHRRRGIGHLLVAECERLARKAGQRWLRLGVLANNESARSFYASLGLEERFLSLEKKLS